MKKIFVLMLLTAIAFTGCKKDKMDKLDEKIIGKWMIADKDGKPELTNKKQVFEFVSPTEAIVSTSLKPKPGMPSFWIDHLKTEVTISGNKVTLTSHPDESRTILDENIITDINDNEFTSNRKLIVTKEGNVVFTVEMVIRFVKVSTDYSKTVLGLWEGRMTSAQSQYGDVEYHRWQYNANGTYVFSMKNGEDAWIPVEDEFSDYFVDGNLLCTRWKNVGEGQEECREWWEIASIENGVMRWTALREDENGQRYTASFEMSKVQ